MTRTRTQIIQEATKRIKNAVAERNDKEAFDAEIVKLSALLKSNEAVADAIVEAIEKSAQMSTISKDEMLDAIRSIVIQAPQVDVPRTQVDVQIPEIRIPKIESPKVVIPEIKLPTINVPEPKVTVNIPEIRIPKIEAPQVNFTMPDVMNVGLDRYTMDTPLPVMQVDPKGNYVAPTQAVGGGGGNSEKTNQILREIKQGQGRASDSPSIDAFGRWRTSDPVTLFDSKQLHDSQPLLWDESEVSGAGTSTVHSTAKARTRMSVSASTAGKRVRQTFMRFNYQPGKSQLVLCTGVLCVEEGNTGIKRGFGFYDNNNGLFLQDNEGVIQFVQRSSTSGSPVDMVVNQADWNIDTMDGNGASGINIDFTKTQICVIDFEWLGVGRVRMGFVIDGKIYYAQQFLNANNLTEVYMSTPNLPIRYEIENLGNGDASNLDHICSTVMSEGGQEQNGILQHVDSATTTALSAGTRYALLGGRLKSTHLDIAITVDNVSLVVANQAGGKLHWEFFIGGTVAGTYTFTDRANSAVQIAQGGATNTYTPGVEIDGGYATDSGFSRFMVPNALRLGSYIDGTPQEWHLVVTPITNNITVQASVTWRELV